jgi:hypothetical protein
MLEASRRQQVPRVRISFIDALRWLRDAKTDTRLTALVINPDGGRLMLMSRRLAPVTLENTSVCRTDARKVLSLQLPVL